MRSKDETRLATNTMAEDSSVSPHPRSNASATLREAAALREEARFARWFWRSNADQRVSRRWLGWLLLSLVNAAFTAYLASFLGPGPGLTLFLLTQSGVTVLAWPSARGCISRTLARLWRKPTRRGQQIQPLADVEFYLGSSKDVLLVSHKDGLAATALVAVDKLPVGIRGNMSAFIRAIYSAGIPLFYTLLHAPIPEQELPRLGAVAEKAQTRLADMEPSQLADFAWRRGGVWKTRLLLGTRRETSALQTEVSQEVLEAQVRQDLQTLQIAFHTAYPHIHLRHLTGHELEDAIRSALLLGRPPSFF